MTRLADVTRPVGPAFFTPITRPRVLQRIDEAAAGRIVLIVAPAGYGKSLALSHWLEHRHRTFLRFDVQPEHNTLLGFVRGIAEALSPASPSLLTTLATAAQSSATAAAPGVEMARWIAANIEGFAGVVAIDDFHRAADDVEISCFVAALIARTKSHVQWVIATRSALDLPVASWLAYGDVHFLIGDRDLTFSEQETRDLSSRGAEPLSETALRELMEATSGWPVALSLALRSAAVIGGEKNLSAATREVLYEYLAEQVYAELAPEERELLHLASYLPEIRVELLEAAGYRESARLLEAVRRRATFLSLKAPGEYQCHELFREFLRRQIETKDPAAARGLQYDAAKALERVGDSVAALRLYTAQRAVSDIVRILCETGFDLMDHAHGDVVESSLSVLPQEVRASNATLLGIRAQRESDLGHFERAENLFKKAIRDVQSEAVRLKLAVLLAVMLRNQGRQMSELLLPLSETIGPLEQRAELLALLAVDRALSAQPEEAVKWIEAAETACALVDCVDVRAKVLLRLGIAQMGIGGHKSGVILKLEEAASLAESVGMLGIASKAYNVLGMAQLFYLDGPHETVKSCKKASAAARKSGDRFALHSALAYAIAAETCLGDEAALQSLLGELEGAATSDSRRHRAIVMYTKATIAGWHGHFKEAAGLMSEIASDGYGYYAFDQALNVATHALYAAIADDSSSQCLLRAAADSFKGVDLYPYGTEKRFVALLFYCLAEFFSGRPERGKHLLRMRRSPASAGTAALFETVKSIVTENCVAIDAVRRCLEPAHIHGYGGVARTIESCALRLIGRSEAKELRLTPAEQQVLRELNEGFNPKEIASRSNRSIHTVKTLIQRAIRRLDCSGTQQALVIARRRGLLSNGGTATKEGRP